MDNIKTNIENHFPSFNPQKITLSRILNSNFRIRYKALRSASSGFISRKEVRLFILNRDKNQCIECGNTDNLQIDHIISVYQYALSGIDFMKLNLPDNLCCLCYKCNASKLP